MKNSKLLRVSSILMIITGTLGLFVSILIIATGSVIFGLLGIAGIGTIITTIILIDTLAWSILELVAGIFGAKNWSNPAQSKKCIILAIIILALSILSNVFAFGYGDGFLFIVLSVVLSLIVPTLYLAGAVQLNKHS